MTKVKLIIELEYDESILHQSIQEDIDWFYKEVLGEASQNHLYNEEIDDSVGTVRVLEVL